MVKQYHYSAQESIPTREPMIPTELPQYPWQKVGADLFNLNGTTYLLLVEYFSRYPEVHKLKSTTSATVIECMKATFSRFGIPETLRSDNGPQFDADEFTHFAQTYSFKHITSSPLFSQSNGKLNRL